MMINVRLRKFLDRHHWPLVTRARYQQNKDNYEAELAHAERTAGDLRVALSECKEKLQEAQKNDHRDPETGRFVPYGETVHTYPLPSGRPYIEGCTCPDCQKNKPNKSAEIE